MGIHFVCLERWKLWGFFALKGRTCILFAENGGNIFMRLIVFMKNIRLW